MTTEKLAEAKRLEGIVGVHRGQIVAIRKKLEMVYEINRIESIEGQADKWHGSVSIDGIYFTPQFAHNIFEQMIEYCEKAARDAETKLEAL